MNISISSSGKIKVLQFMFIRTHFMFRLNICSIFILNFCISFKDVISMPVSAMASERHVFPESETTLF